MNFGAFYTLQHTYPAAEPGTTPPPHTHPSLCVFPSDQMQLSAASFKHPYTLWQDVVCGATTGAAHTWAPSQSHLTDLKAELGPAVLLLLVMCVCERQTSVNNKMLEARAWKYAVWCLITHHHNIFMCWTEIISFLVIKNQFCRTIFTN